MPLSNSSIKIHICIRNIWLLNVNINSLYDYNPNMFSIFFQLSQSPSMNYTLVGKSKFYGTYSPN